MEMTQFNIFLVKKMFMCLKSSSIEGNLGRSPSYLISVDAKFVLINLFYETYIVTIR